jgi:uncharacterized membrane protein YadS
MFKRRFLSVDSREPKLPVRSKLKTVVTVALEAASFIGSTGGAAIAAVFGKALLALLLGAFALGVFFRLTSRRRRTLTDSNLKPIWLAPAVALLSTAESILLVESVDLPVRLSQPGFQYSHWLIVLAFLAVSYTVQTKLVRQLIEKNP